MSAYGSSAYGSLPVDGTASLDLPSTSVFEVREGRFTTVTQTLTLIQPTDFGAIVLTRADKTRGLYPGEVYVYEEDYIADVDVDFKPGAPTFTYLTANVSVPTVLSLGTQAATGFLRFNIEYAQGDVLLTLGTQPATAGFTGFGDNNAGGEWVDNNLGGPLINANA